MILQLFDNFVTDRAEISVRKVESLLTLLFVCSDSSFGQITTKNKGLLVTSAGVTQFCNEDFINCSLARLASGLGEARRINFLRRIISSSRGELDAIIRTSWMLNYQSGWGKLYWAKDQRNSNEKAYLDL